MVRVLVAVLALHAVAHAQPAPTMPAITSEPAPPSSTPPAAYPPPPSTPPAYPSYEPARRLRSDRLFFALNAVVGGGEHWLYGAYGGEVGVLLVPAELRIRARAFGTIYGGTMESDWGGDFWRYGGGIEARWCSPGLRSCLFGDFDAAVQKLSLYDGSSDFVRSDTGLVIGPRFGFDFGGAVRGRFALELYEVIGQHKTRDGTTSTKRFETGALSFALGYEL
jgi:hypothetical protein